MVLPDVNVLVYAHRAESPDHPRYARWLTELASGRQPFALSDLVCSAFLRIVTIPGLWTPPTELPAGTAFLRNLRARSNCRPLRPGPENWEIFTRLCEGADARGKLVSDAYHAALAIEHGCELVTADADFARFPGLRWRHPFQAAR